MALPTRSRTFRNTPPFGSPDLATMLCRKPSGFLETAAARSAAIHANNAIRTPARTQPAPPTAAAIVLRLVLATAARGHPSPAESRCAGLRAVPVRLPSAFATRERQPQRERESRRVPWSTAQVQG